MTLALTLACLFHLILRSQDKKHIGWRGMKAVNSLLTEHHRPAIDISDIHSVPSAAAQRRTKSEAAAMARAQHKAAVAHRQQLVLMQDALEKRRLDKTRNLQEMSLQFIGMKLLMHRNKIREEADKLKAQEEARAKSKNDEAVKAKEEPAVVVKTEAKDDTAAPPSALDASTSADGSGAVSATPAAGGDRNKAPSSSSSSSSTSSTAVANDRIRFPFVLLDTANDTSINCELTSTHEQVIFMLSQEYSLHDDGVLLQVLAKQHFRSPEQLSAPEGTGHQASDSSSSSLLDVIPPEIRNQLPEYAQQVVLQSAVASAAQQQEQQQQSHPTPVPMPQLLVSAQHSAVRPHGHTSSLQPSQQQLAFQQQHSSASCINGITSMPPTPGGLMPSGSNMNTPLQRYPGHAALLASNASSIGMGSFDTSFMSSSEYPHSALQREAGNIHLPPGNASGLHPSLLQGTITGLTPSRPRVTFNHSTLVTPVTKRVDALVSASHASGNANVLELGGFKSNSLLPGLATPQSYYSSSFNGVGHMASSDMRFGSPQANYGLAARIGD